MDPDYQSRIALDIELTSVEKLIALAISWSAEAGRAEVSSRQLAAMASCAPATVFRGVKRLEALGWVQRHAEPGRPTTYVLTTPSK